MATNVFARAVNFDVPAGGGSIDVTGAFNGATPKAVLLLYTFHAGTNGTETDSAVMSIGMSDGTRHRTTAIRSRDGQAATSSTRTGQDNVVIWSDNLIGTADVQGTLTGFIEDGATFSFTNSLAVARSMTAIFFFGDDLSAFVNDSGSLGAGAGTVSISGVGFQGDVGIFVSVNTVFNAIDTQTNDAQLSIGIASRTSGGGAQHCVSFAEDTAVAAGGQPAARLVSNSAIAPISVADGTVLYTGTVGNWGADGFDIVLNASSGSTECMFLILKLGDMANSLFVHDTAIVTGSQSVTTPAFQPQFGLVIGSNLEAVDTTTFDSQLAGGLFVSCFDAAEGAAAHTIRVNSATDPSDTASNFNELAIQAPIGTSTTGITATNSGFTSVGWTFNYTATQGTAKKVLILAIEQGDTLSSPVAFTFGDFTDDTFVDWSIDGAPGADFDSYLRTFYHAVEDQMFFMQAPFIYTYLENEDPDADTESLFLRGAWDWSSSADSHHWSRSQQVYRFRDENLVAASRTKIRGRGRVLQLRYDSESGKDFKLYGWGLPIGKNTES